MSEGDNIMKGKKIMSLFLAVSLVALTACGGAKDSGQKTSNIKEGGTLILAAGGDPNVLNPMYGNDRVTMTINNSLYAPLFEKINGKIKYYLAEDFKVSDDYLTYTIKLKKDLKWHDGTPITADDIVFTVDKITDEKQNCMSRPDYFIDDKKVEYKKVDDQTVEFKLPKVSMAFEGVLEGIRPIPKHVFEGEEDIAKSNKNENPIGSGPYKFKEAKKGESVTLEKFDDYVDGKPHIDSVVFRVIPDTNASNTALLNGEISAKYLKAQDVEKFKEKTNVVIYNEGMLNNMVFNFNNKTLAKTEVRKAIAYALNKDELLKAGNVSTEFAEPAYSVFTPDTEYYTDDVEKYDYNVDKAKELMTKDGEKDLKLKLAYINGSKDGEAEVLVIQQKLKEIGINVELLPMEINAFIQKLYSMNENNDFDLALNGYVMGSEPDSYKSIFMTSDGNNVSNYSNKELDPLWEKANLETDKTKREAIYKELQQKLADELPLYPMVYPKSMVGVDKKIGGTEEARPAPIYMFRDLSKLYFTE